MKQNVYEIMYINVYLKNKLAYTVSNFGNLDCSYMLHLNLYILHSNLTVQYVAICINLCISFTLHVSFRRSSSLILFQKESHNLEILQLPYLVVTSTSVILHLLV